MTHWSRANTDRVIELGRQGLTWKVIGKAVGRDEDHTRARFGDSASDEDKAARRAACAEFRRQSPRFREIEKRPPPKIRPSQPPRPVMTGRFYDDPRAKADRGSPGQCRGAEPFGFSLMGCATDSISEWLTNS